MVTDHVILMMHAHWMQITTLMLMVYALWRVDYVPGPVQVVLYPIYVLAGVAILYSLMITLATTAVWLGRNQTLYNFWFYITNFSRYPMEIYSGTFGTPLRRFFTFIIPVLIVVNVPARLLVRPLDPRSTEDWLKSQYEDLETWVRW